MLVVVVVLIRAVVFFFSPTTTTITTTTTTTNPTIFLLNWNGEQEQEQTKNVLLEHFEPYGNIRTNEPIS